MPHDVPHLRLYAPDSPEAMAHELASRELLRPTGDRARDRELEPYSRAWFEEIEQKRYTRAGEWLPRVLEFSRHRDESLLMLGPGLGSDAIQYGRHGTRVTLATAPGDAVDAIRRNFAHRGSEPTIVPIVAAGRLPFANGEFDLAYWNLLHDAPVDPAATVAELHRVLKSGGKLFALAPARYDVDHWQRWLLPFRRLFAVPSDPFAASKRTARELRRCCAGFERITIVRRHLRRSELPPIWRAIPPSLLERVAGRVMALRATKPVRIASTKARTSAA
jgi:SAM-dependent methyltransferase